MKSVREICEVYQRRTYETYLGRLQMAKRLKNTQVLWKRITAALNFTTLIAMIFPLIYSDWVNESSHLNHVNFAIATITITAIVANQYYSLQGYERRIVESERNYSDIQEISQEFEIISGRSNIAISDVKLLIERYQEIIKRTENHETKDYKSSLRERSRIKRRTVS